MKNIILVGAGNVSTHLGIALKNCNYKIVQVYSRSNENAKKLAQKLNADFTNDLTQLKDANLIIVSVNDDAISDVLSQLKNTATVHTSGSIGLDIFNNNFSNCGVFYPIQTFNKEVDVNISEVPFCIEGNSLHFENQLTQIAKRISKNVVIMDSEQRKQLHIAAVFACNFSNHMYSIADTILSKSDIEFKLLVPLINQTVSKLTDKKPGDVQTGPAKRNNKEVIDSHLNNITDQTAKEIYRLISNSIIKNND